MVLDRDALGAVLNHDYPGIDKALDSPDPIHGFACFFRSYLDSTKDRFFSIPYETPENAYKLAGESDEEACRRIASGTLVSVAVPSAFGSVDSVDWHSNPTFNGYKEWTWQLSRHNDIKLLAHEYLRTGRSEYASAASSLLASWIRTCPAPDADTSGGETDTWRTIECGIRMGANWPYIIYAFYPVFSDELLSAIALSLYQHGERLERNHMSGNWLLMEMNGLMHIAVLFPFFRRSAHWKGFALSMMEEEARKQFYPDGMQYELTTCYHEVAINNYQRMLELMKAFSLEIPGELFSIMENAAEANIKLMEPDGMLPDINDGSSSDVSALLVPKSRLFANDAIRFFATGGKEGHLPSYESVALPYSGFFAFRTGWSDKDAYALLDSAPFGKGHQHEDKLSLIVSSGRKRVITEGGCYAYDDSPMRKHTISSFCHNVLIIDGMGQNRRKSYVWHDDEIKAESGMVWKVSDDVDFAEGEYSGPYGEDECHPAVWKRCVYFIKHHPLFSRPFLVVVDRVEAEDSHEYCFLWHVDSERVSISARDAIYSDVHLSFPEGGSLSVTRGAMHPVAGFIATGKEQGMYKAVDRLGFRITASTARSVTVISLEGGDLSVEASPDACCTDITIIRDGSRITLEEKELRRGRL